MARVMLGTRRKAVITGASSGLGELFARRFAGRGYDLVVSARRADRLETLAAEIESHAGVAVQVLPVDLGEADGPTQLAESVLAHGGIDLLVNSAGFGPGGAFEQVPLERHLACIDVNVRALVELTGRFQRSLVERGGAIINVASTASFQPVPYHGVYAATKAFVLSFSEALSEELRGRVRVCAVCPGLTATEFFASNHPSGNPPDVPFVVQGAEECIDAALRGFDAGRPVVVTGSLNWLGAVLASKAPKALVRRLTAQIFRRAF